MRHERRPAPVEQDLFLNPDGFEVLTYPAGITVEAHRQYHVSFVTEIWSSSPTADREFGVRVRGSSATDAVNILWGRCYALAYKIGDIPPPE